MGPSSGTRRANVLLIPSAVFVGVAVLATAIGLAEGTTVHWVIAGFSLLAAGIQVLIWWRAQSTSAREQSD